MRTIPSICINVFFCLMSIWAYTELPAQSPYVDSLKRTLLTTENDSLYNVLLFDIVSNSFNKSIDTSAKYLNIIADRIDTSSNGKLTQHYFKFRSIIARQNGDAEVALHLIEKAIDLNDDKPYGLTRLDFAREQLAALNAKQDYTSLISVGLKLLSTYPDTLTKSIGDVHRSIASAYRRTKRYELSSEYHNNAKDIYKQLGNEEMVGGQYLNLGSLYGSLKEFDKCIDNFKKAIVIAKQKPNLYMLSMASQNLSHAFSSIDQLDSAFYYLNVAKDAASGQNNAMLNIKIDHRKASILIKQNKHDQALIILRDLNERTENKEEYFFRSSILKNLATCLEETGKYSEANSYLRTAMSLKDSIYQEDMADAISDATEKYESEKKEAEINRLALEEELNQTQISRQRLALGATFGAFSLLAFFFYRLFKQKNIISRQNQEKETLLKEIHHRVKNNLQTVSSLLGMQSRFIKDKAAKEAIQEGRARVHSMSLIHRDLYRKDNLSGVNMATYVPKLCNDLIKTYNIDKVINLETNIDPITLDVESVIPLGLIINELLTNSIKYAFVEKDKGVISIILKEVNEQLQLHVKDNGIGLTDHQLKHKKDSFGHTLISAFKQKLNAQIEIDGTQGTTFSIYINNYNKLT